MSIKTKVKLLILLILIVTIYGCSKKIYNQSVDLYNNSINLGAEYNQKVSEQITTYDANYLAFIEKTNIANVNKETFIVVTEIIMNNRKDGASVAWKWTQENQQIPYSEFTAFYKELTGFVSRQYQTLSRIETEKQLIVAKHNIMISVFPNNLYNRWMHIKPLQYKPGFLSDRTKTLFNVK